MIRCINEHDWPAIMAIQAECYHAFEPEPLPVMQSKWRLSPQTCLVFCAPEQGMNERVLGYCLAHPWHDTPPALNECLPSSLNSASTLYLHDMAFAKAAQGLGGGAAFMQALISYAKAQGYAHISLVAVQGAQSYWEKWGFSAQPCAKSLHDYGDDAQYMRYRLS